MVDALRVLSFFFNDTATTEIYTLSLHDALPISAGTDESETLAADAAPTGAEIALLKSETQLKAAEIGRAHV